MSAKDGWVTLPNGLKVMRRAEEEQAIEQPKAEPAPQQRGMAQGLPKGEMDSNRRGEGYLARMGRVCWWGALAITAGIAVFGGGWLVSTASRYGGRFEWDDFFAMIALSMVTLLVGRALRYVLAAE